MFVEKWIWYRSKKTPFVFHCERSFFLDNFNDNFLDRPFLTFDEQINLLREEKKISIPESERENAISILSVVPYHTLINGYKDLYATNDTFEKGTSLTLLFMTHIIYTSINSIIFKYILHIENSLTAKMGYCVSENYGVETNTERARFVEVSRDSSDYLSLHHYIGSARKKKLIQIIKLCRNPFKDTLIHHYTTTKNHLPPWIVANDLSFGKTYNWYSILRGEQKTWIVNEFLPDKPGLIDEEKKEFFHSAMKQLIEFRDRVAHSNKTVGLKMSKYLPVNATLKLIEDDAILTKEEMIRSFGKNDLYSVILSVLLLLNNTAYASTFIDELIHLFNQYNEVTYLGYSLFEILNLPKDIENRLITFWFTYYHHGEQQ